MPHIFQLVATIGRDPLTAVFGLFVAGGLAAHLMFRRHRAARAAVRVVFFVFLTVAFSRADIVPYRHPHATGHPLYDAVHGVLEIAWWLWAAWFAVGLLRAFVVFERRPHEGKLVHDLLAGVIYLAAIFAIVAFVLDLPIEGLLATSGAVAIVLGLALQTTLSDVFSGIVLNFSRPYRPGDWISIEGCADGRVIEINWRATHVLTAKRDLAIVPNSAIAKARIVNSSSPSDIHGMSVTVQVDTGASPSSCREILETAVLNCRSIVKSPAPTVTVKSLNMSCTEFEVGFFVENLGRSATAQNDLYDMIFRHLYVSGIGLAATQTQSPRDPIQAEPSSPTTAAEKLLRLVAIFDALSSDERRSIAAKLKESDCDQGEVLVAPGQVVNSLFIVGTGVLSATRIETVGEIELVRFGPGDHYGEIGMLTGAPSIAKISTLTPATVYELAKQDLAPILKSRPQVAQKLSRALAALQAAGRLSGTAALDETVASIPLTVWFSRRLHRLYERAGASGQ